MDTPLPFADYDQMSPQEISTRIRGLDADQVGALVEHEGSHADRPAVRQILEHRLQQLHDGATPTDSQVTGPWVPRATTAPDPTPPARPQTQGPPQNPPSQGDPTNPAQPRG